MDAVALEARTFDEFERSKAEVQNRRRGVTKFAKLLFLYYAFGVFMYTSVVEGFTFTDAVYFVTVTFTTVGFGKVVPGTSAGRVFTAVFISAGMVLLAVVLTEAARAVGEGWAKRRRAARAAAVAAAAGLPGFLPGQEHPLEQRWPLGGWLGRGAAFAQAHRAATRIAGMACFLLLYALLFWGLERQSLSDQGPRHTFTDAVYFAVVASTTIGYGDIYPQTNGAKWATVLLLPPAVVILSASLSSVAELIIDGDVEKGGGGGSISGSLRGALRLQRMRWGDSGGSFDDEGGGWGRGADALPLEIFKAAQQQRRRPSGVGSSRSIGSSGGGGGGGGSGEGRAEGGLALSEAEYLECALASQGLVAPAFLAALRRDYRALATAAQRQIARASGDRSASAAHGNQTLWLAPVAASPPPLPPTCNVKTEAGILFGNLQRSVLTVAEAQSIISDAVATGDYRPQDARAIWDLVTSLAEAEDDQSPADAASQAAGDRLFEDLRAAAAAAHSTWDTAANAAAAATATHGTSDTAANAAGAATDDTAAADASPGARPNPSPSGVAPSAVERRFPGRGRAPGMAGMAGMAPGAPRPGAAPGLPRGGQAPGIYHASPGLAVEMQPLRRSGGGGGGSGGNGCGNAGHDDGELDSEARAFLLEGGLLRHAEALASVGFRSVGDLCFPGLAEGGILKQAGLSKMDARRLQYLVDQRMEADRNGVVAYGMV